MAPDKELIDGAYAFARTLGGPAGRISFDAAVSQHLGWFTAALARGLSWNHVIELLRRAGATRDDGRPLNRGHLSSVYARQKRKAGNDGITVDAGQLQGSASKPVPVKREIPRPVRARPAPANARSPSIPVSAPPGTASAPDSAAIRTFMSRAAQLRKSNHDRD